MALKLKPEQANATFYHPDGSVIELSEADEKQLEKVYEVAPTLFEDKPKQLKNAPK